MAEKALTRKTIISIKEIEVVPLLESCLSSVREDLQENPYIVEALKVLPVGGYRSAIGSFWNAVVDDLRNKIIHRSVKLFNKAVNVGREVKTYDDFQQCVNDDQLIEGAYKIGVIGFEASKILKHAKETRHFFDGHPKSSNPSIIKVLGMMDDCVKYVLNLPYPAQIIDIDDYMKVVDSPDFDRSEVSMEIGLTELPETYKVELANRLYSSYIHPNASSVLRSNIEFIIPILWRVLPKDTQVQIARRIDQEIGKGNATITEQAFQFIKNAGTTSYLSPAARRYKIQPIVKKLKENLDAFNIENECVQELAPYASIIPPEAVNDFVWSLTHTYVGHTGYSLQWSRTNFYADTAAYHIPSIFQLFDDRAAEAFVATVKTSTLLHSRISNPAKMTRLRSLGGIVLGKVSSKFTHKKFLETLCDENNESELWKTIKKEANIK